MHEPSMLGHLDLPETNICNYRNHTFAQNLVSFNERSIFSHINSLKDCKNAYYGAYKRYSNPKMLLIPKFRTFLKAV
jgi:hypothetical protein